MNKIRIALVFLSGFIAAPAMGQQFDEGTVEVSGGVGLSGGIGSVDEYTDMVNLIEDLEGLLGNQVTFDPGDNTKWNFGFAAGYGFRPDLMFVGEVVKTRLLNPTLTVGTPITEIFEFTSSLVEVTGGLQYQIPIENTNTAPYVTAGLGIARTSVNLSGSPFSVLDLNLSATDFTAHVGGGARVYFGQNWGIRPELKFAFIPDESWVRTAVHLFYQFGN